MCGNSLTCTGCGWVGSWMVIGPCAVLTEAVAAAAEGTVWTGVAEGRVVTGEAAWNVDETK